MEVKKVVESYFEALAKGDIQTAFSFFTDDAKWHQPGKNKFSGQKNNPDQIGQMLGQMTKDVAGSLVVKPTGPLMVSGDLVASPVRFSAAKGSKNIDMTGVDLFEVKNGKIARVWLFSENQMEEDEFWGK